MKRAAAIFFAVLLSYTLFGQGSIKTLKRSARSGDVMAQYQLATAYEQKGGNRNLRRAVDYYERAAKANLDSAQFALGRLYENGNGVGQNYQLAIQYYKAAATQDHAASNFKLGTIFENGIGPIAANQQMAINYYLKARNLGMKGVDSRLETLPVDSLGFSNSVPYILFLAEKGNVENEYKAGMLYLEGKEVERDVYKAFTFLRSAAEKDYGPAQLALGKIYAQGLKSGKVDVQRNDRLAVLNFVKASNNGLPAADKELAKYEVGRYLKSNNPDFQIYQARQGGAGSANQQYALYQKYLRGDGVTKDQNKAFEYLQMAALEGNKKAMLELAESYDKGTFTTPSAANAFKWYQKAAEAKSDTAKLIVADRYALGRGTAQNIGQAIRYYLRLATADAGELSVKARFKLAQYKVEKYIDPNDLDYIRYKAANGDSGAQMQVANYYEGKKDGEAVRWYRMAAESNILEANRKLGDIYLYGQLGQVPDIRKAIEYYYAAAQLNDLHSMKMLAYMYSQGLIPGEGENYELGLQLTDKYLQLTASNPEQRDNFIYKVIGDMHAINEAYMKAVPYYTGYINNFNNLGESPINLLLAMDARAMAYYNIQNFESSLTDIEIASLQLEQLKDHESVQPHYQRLKGVLNYRKGKVLVAQGNLTQACKAFGEARLFGIDVEKSLTDLCNADAK